MPLKGLPLWLVMTSVLLIGCGENNLFNSLADDSSKQAKLEEAQQALDKGDCQKAIDLFSELQADDLDSVDLRIDLAAAHMCKAGFNVTAFISIAADFGGNAVSQTQLFQVIADKAVALTSSTSTWPQDLSTAEGLLSPFESNPDAAFNLAIVRMIKAVLTVVDILNYFDAAVACASDIQQGSAAFTNCVITAQNALSIVNALQSSSSLLATLGVPSDVTDTINTVLNDMNSTSPSNPISCSDITQYLISQGIDPGEQAVCTA